MYSNETTENRLKRERDLLGEALGKILIAAGDIDPTMSLTGPDLLLAADDYLEQLKPEKHNISVGALVQLAGGARLFIGLHTRDADQKPLYSLAPFRGNQTNQYAWLHGFKASELTVLPPSSYFEPGHYEA